MINEDDARFSKAVSEKRFDVIEVLFPLVSKGVKRQYITGDEFNPLHYASSPEIVQFFISSGIDVNIKHPETDETPLLTVIKLSKSPEVVRELLNYGASIEARNKYSLNTPLNQATLIPECPLETIQVLLENGAVVNTANIYCDTPLHNACRSFRGDLKIIELLLKFGSPVNFRNLRGDTPLNVSLKNSFCTAELVRKLLKFNAKVTVKTLEHSLEVHNDYLSIITELLQDTSVTSAEHWSYILQYFVEGIRNEQKLLDCGRLIIKYSFLKCDDLHASFVRALKKMKGFAMYTSPFIHSCHLRGIVPKQARDYKNFLASVTDNLKSFCDDCFSEIKHMKRDRFENNISVYEFIISKTNKFPLDSKILQLLKENTYPIYADIIFKKIKRAALLDKLILQQIYTIVQRADVTQRIVLDVFSVYNIAKYLNVDEIRNFVDAFYNPSKREYCFWDSLVEIEDNLATRPVSRRSVTKKKMAPVIAHSSKVQKKASPRI